MSLEPPTAKPMVSESLDQGNVIDGAPLGTPAASWADGGDGAFTEAGGAAGDGWVGGVGGVYCAGGGVSVCDGFGARAQAETSAVARSIRISKTGIMR